MDNDDKMTPAEERRILAALTIGKLEGDCVKVRLPGETPWVEITEVAPDRMKGRITNKLYRQFSEHEKAQFLAREGFSPSPLPELHEYSQNDELWFVKDEHGEWVPEEREMTNFEHKLVSLLDRIEIEGDPTLASQRHALAEEQGYTVVITNERVSGETH